MPPLHARTPTIPRPYQRMKSSPAPPSVIYANCHSCMLIIRVTVRSIDAVSSHTSEVVSVHLTGSLALLTQRGTDPRVLGVAFQWLFLSSKLETQEKASYPKYSSQFQLYSS